MFQLRKLLPRRLKSLTYYMTHPVSYPLNLAITSSFSGMGKTPNDMAIWKQLEFNSRKSGWKIPSSWCFIPTSLLQPCSTSETWGDQGCANNLTASSPGKENPGLSPFLWYKYFQHEQFQLTYVVSLNLELGISRQ